MLTSVIDAYIYVIYIYIYIYIFGGVNPSKSSLSRAALHLVVAPCEEYEERVDSPFWKKESSDRIRQETTGTWPCMRYQKVGDNRAGLRGRIAAATRNVPCQKAESGGRMAKGPTGNGIGRWRPYICSQVPIYIRPG